MASKPETTFYTSVHRHLPPEKELHREKMCNPYAGGTWDFWFSGERDLWVEYKFVVLPKRSETMIDVTLSTLQVQWGAGRMAEGRNLAVIVGCKEGGILLRNLEWECPLSRDEFLARMHSRVELADMIIDLTRN